MDAIQKNVAVARGEAMAATLLATAALQVALGYVKNKAELLDAIERQVNGTLNMSGPGRGDTNDEFNTQMRETARFSAIQQLDALRSMIPPKR